MILILPNTSLLLLNRLYRADEHGPLPPPADGWHGGPPVSHQHIQALAVPHVRLGLANERPGLALPRHHLILGFAIYIAAVHAQHELWTQQSTGEQMFGVSDGHLQTLSDLQLFIPQRDLNLKKFFGLKET